MQPQDNPCKVLLGLHGDSTEGFLLKNLYCLECTQTHTYKWVKITNIYLFLDQTLANLDVEIHVSFSILWFE